MSADITASQFGATVSFWFYSEVFMPLDEFSFFLDGGNILKRSSHSDGWEEFSFNLTPGVHDVSWQYTSHVDPSLVTGAVWVDNIKVVPFP